MHIDVITKSIQAKSVPHSIFTGIKYILIYTNGLNTSWDGESTDYDWNNPTKQISVLWSKNDLKAFRPNDTVYNVISEIKRLDVERLKMWRKIKRKGVIPRYPTQHEHAQYIVPFLENHIPILLEINFN